MFEIEERLENKGITLDAIVEAAMGLYVSHGITGRAGFHEYKSKNTEIPQGP